MNLFLIFILLNLKGLFNSMGLNALYGIAGYLPENYIISMNTGQAFSGIFMNIIRYLTLYFFFESELNSKENKEKKYYESLIYYLISAFICLISLIFCFIVYEDKYFQMKLRNSGEFKIKMIIKESEILTSNRTSLNLEVIYFIFYIKGNLNINQNTFENSIYNRIDNNNNNTEINMEKNIGINSHSVFSYLLDLNVLVFINFFVTFCVFPGAAIQNNLL
jgi:hypothetical protein